MNKQYTKKQIQEAISYWKKRLNESRFGVRDFVYLVEPYDGKKDITHIVHFNKATNPNDNGALTNSFQTWAKLNHPEMFKDFQVRWAQENSSRYPTDDVLASEYDEIYRTFWDSEDDLYTALCNTPLRIVAGVDSDFIEQFKRCI